jgi:hypothetical protein
MCEILIDPKLIAFFVKFVYGQVTELREGSLFLFKMRLRVKNFSTEKRSFGQFLSDPSSNPGFGSGSETNCRPNPELFVSDPQHCVSGYGSSFSRIRIQLPKLIEIRIQLRKLMRIRIRNSGGRASCVRYLNAGVPDVRQVPLCVILEIIGHRDPEGALPPLQIVLVDHA